MTCKKCEGTNLRIFTNSIATLRRVWLPLHTTVFSDFVLFRISFIFVNYIFILYTAWPIWSGLLECPTAFLHLANFHKPCAFRRKIMRWNVYDYHPKNTFFFKFLVSLAIYWRSIAIKFVVRVVTTKQPAKFVCVFVFLYWPWKMNDSNLTCVKSIERGGQSCPQPRSYQKYVEPRRFADTYLTF